MRLSSDLSSIDESLCWTLGVHDSKGSSAYSRAETRVESLKLPNRKKRRPGRSPTVPISYELYSSRRGRTVLNCFRTTSRAMHKGYSRCRPKAGLFQVNCHTAYSDVREWRKNTFPETEKAFLSSPPGLPKSPDRQKGKKGRVLESPRYPRDVMPSLC